MKENGPEISRSFRRVLLGPDAHHRRDDQTGLDAVREQHQQPRKREAAELLGTQVAGDKQRGEEVGAADDNLVR